MEARSASWRGLGRGAARGCYEKLPDKTKIEKPIHLFYTNKEVAEWNETKLNEIPGKCYMSYADNIVVGNGPNTAKDSLLKWAVDKKRKLNDTENMPQTISLKIEGRYMILKNIDVEDGLVNGISGRKHLASNFSLNAP